MDSGARLNKFLSEGGHCSRREADRLIEQGRVTIDGARGRLGDRVPPGAEVRVDGRPVASRAPKVYLALNKPVGIVCTADPREPLNVIDYLHYPQRVFPVGRLDKNSSGLLLLTSDGEIVNRLLRAAGGHEREYLVEVDRPVTPAFLQKMAAGVKILGTVTLPCRTYRTGERGFGIVLTQGLNRQIRRMCEALGYRVRSLTRVRIMNVRLGDLAPGQYRALTDEELQALLNEL